jgi:hypothetical protein
MREDHEVCGRPEEFALSVPGADATGDAPGMLLAGATGVAAAGELSRLACELGLGAFAHNIEALKSELQKIILGLHPDKSGGEFKSDGDKARFMKARSAIELLNSDSAADAPRASTQLAGAPQAITDKSAPASSSWESEHRLQVSLLTDAGARIARYFAAPKIVSMVLAVVFLVLVLAGDRFERNPVLGPLLREPAVVMLLGVLAFAALAAAVALWLCERAAITHAAHLLSESALGELFEQARRSARRQGRSGQLSAFDIRRGIDVLADGCGVSGAPRARRLLGRSLDGTTRDCITLIQTKRLLARRVIRVIDRPSLEVLYEVSPAAVRETFR